MRDDAGHPGKGQGESGGSTPLRPKVIPGLPLLRAEPSASPNVSAYIDKEPRDWWDCGYETVSPRRIAFPESSWPIFDLSCVVRLANYQSRLRSKSHEQSIALCIIN